MRQGGSVGDSTRAVVKLTCLASKERH